MKVVKSQKGFFLGLVEVAEIIKGKGQELAVIFIRSLLTASQQLQRYFLFALVDILECQVVQLLNLSGYGFHSLLFYFEILK